MDFIRKSIDDAREESNVKTTQNHRKTVSHRPISIARPARRQTQLDLPTPAILPHNPSRASRATSRRVRDLNIFVFTSKGSKMIACPQDSDVEWLLATATRQFSIRGLTQPLAYARLEDGSTLEFDDLLHEKCREHPVSRNFNFRRFYC